MLNVFFRYCNVKKSSIWIRTVKSGRGELKIRFVHTAGSMFIEQK